MPRRAALLPLALTMLALPASAAHAVTPGQNGRVAFDSDHDGASDIYTVAADGSDVQRLTTSDEFEDNPSWSPDGRRIAYIRAQQVWVMNADGSDQRQVTRMREDLRDPAWSPNGRRILFASDNRGEDLYTIAPNGSRPKRITRTPRVAEFQPSYSPDGRRIAYVRERNENYKIAVARSNGSREKVILPRYRNTQLGPNWSPDGRRITFYNVDGYVFVVSPSGRNRRRVEFGSSPTFSPDGNFIAVSEQDEEGEEGTIFGRSQRGGEDIQLSPFRMRDLCDNPDWQTLDG